MHVTANAKPKPRQCHFEHTVPVRVRLQTMLLKSKRPLKRFSIPVYVRLQAMLVKSKRPMRCLRGASNQCQGNCKIKGIRRAARPQSLKPPGLPAPTKW